LLSLAFTGLALAADESDQHQRKKDPARKGTETASFLDSDIAAHNPGDDFTNNCSSLFTSHQKTSAFRGSLPRDNLRGYKSNLARDLCRRLAEEEGSFATERIDSPKPAQIPRFKQLWKRYHKHPKVR
jgi:hypothetical protein